MINVTVTVVFTEEPTIKIELSDNNIIIITVTEPCMFQFPSIKARNWPASSLISAIVYSKLTVFEIL